MSQNTKSQSNCAWRNTTLDGTCVEIYHDDGEGDIHGVIRSSASNNRYLTSWNRYGIVKFCVSPSGVLQSIPLHADGQSGINLVSIKPQIDWSMEEPWVKAIAMDFHGKWYRYDTLPGLNEIDAIWVSIGNWHEQIHPDCVPDYNGDYRDSLIIRPK